MLDIITSAMGTPIRLTDERWAHIVEEHNELAGLRLDVLETVGHPEIIVDGRAGELLAIQEYEPGKWIVAVYRELNGDGFIDYGLLDQQERFPNEKEANLALKDLNEYLSLVPAVRHSPKGYLWSSYDEEADVLCINFKKPSYATDSELTDDDIILRYEGEEVIGITILHASQR